MLDEIIFVIDSIGGDVVALCSFCCSSCCWGCCPFREWESSENEPVAAVGVVGTDVAAKVGVLLAAAVEKILYTRPKRKCYVL